MRQRSWWAAMAIAASTGGCAVSEPAPGSAATQAIIVPTGGGCSRFGCGTNSPEIDVFELHELSLTPGERNTQGFEIEVAKLPQLMRGGVSYELRVVDG